MCCHLMTKVTTIVWQLTKSISEKREMTGLELVSFVRRPVDRRGRRTFLWRDNRVKIGFIILRQLRKGTEISGWQLRKGNARHLALGYKSRILVLLRVLLT